MNSGIALVCALSFALAACSGGGKAGEGSGTPSGKAADGSSGKTYTIEYWSIPIYQSVEGAPSPSSGEWEKMKIKEFEAQNPTIKVNFQTIPFDQSQNKIGIAVAGNNAPDVVLESIDRNLMKYVESGKSEPLDDFIEDVKNDFNAEMLKKVTRDGKLYGIPVTLNPEYFFLNAGLFKAKGLEHLIPKDDRMWTIEEMVSALKQVTGNGVYGTAMWAANEQGDEMNLMRLFGMGAEQWNESSTQIVIDQYPQAAEGLKQLVGMLDEGIMAPGPATTAALDAVELFKQNKIAMIPFANGLWSLVEAGKKDGSTDPRVELFGMAPPHAKGVTPKVASAFHGYQVFKQSDPQKREAIKKFVRFMIQPEHIRAVSKSGNYIPSRKSAGYQFANPDIQAAIDVVAKLPLANIGVSSAYFADVRKMWYPELQAILLKKKTPEQGLKDYAKKANDFLADKQKK
jgi:multiple sugar transport system substrate-binding protein